MKNLKNEGTGHKAKIAAVLRGKIEIDGEKTDFKFDYQFDLTVEQIEYAVRRVAGSIAQAASKIAQNGTDGTRKEGIKKEVKA